MAIRRPNRPVPTTRLLDPKGNPIVVNDSDVQSFIKRGFKLPKVSKRSLAKVELVEEDLDEDPDDAETGEDDETGDESLPEHIGGEMFGTLTLRQLRAVADKAGVSLGARDTKETIVAKLNAAGL